MCSGFVCNGLLFCGTLAVAAITAASGGGVDSPMKNEMLAKNKLDV